MDVLLQQIINGLVLGSMYALVALGYTMVYGIIGLINFAHGDVLMVGALTSWTIIGIMREASPGMPLWMVLLFATLIAMVVCAALNFVIEKLAYRPLRNSSRLAPLITAFDFGATAKYTTHSAKASSPSGDPRRSYTSAASSASRSARGSARPMSSLAMRINRRAR